MPYRQILLLFIVLLLASCSGGGIKYPSPHAVYLNKQTPHISRSKKITKIAVKHTEFCSIFYMITKGKLTIAQRKLKKLENSKLSADQYANVYALLGVINFLKHGDYSDYAEVSVAYNLKNSIAIYLLNKRPAKKRLFYIAREYLCKH